MFKGNEIVGVITYGTPSSAPLRRGIAGFKNRNNVIELTRLWICDDVPKNGESWFISNTVSRVNKEIIVSYADTSMGHIGIVYQASNWLYTGLSAKRTNWVIEGIDKHCQTIADKMTSIEIREKYGEKFKLVKRSIKHRYVYLNGKSKKRNIILRKELLYPVLPYPKNGDPLSSQITKT
jgi:hypothetical protein